MSSHGIADRVAIVGMGCTPFGEHWGKSAEDLLLDATSECFAATPSVRRADVDAYWLGTLGSGQSGLTLSKALAVDYKPVTRVENYCASGSESFRNACYAVASGAYDVVMATGVEKLKDSGFSGLLRGDPPGDGTAPELSMTAPAAFSMLDPAYCARYGVDLADMRAAMTHVAWKNHVNGARNAKAQFRSEVSKEKIEAAPKVAGRLGVFDCSGVSDGAACALIVRAEDALDYTDSPVYVKALALAAGGLWRALAAAISRDGGQILLSTEVESIEVESMGTGAGRVTCAVLNSGGQRTEVRARFVVSDVGPAATVRLSGAGASGAGASGAGASGAGAFGDGYLAAVKRADRPCAMIAVNFASTQRLIDVPGMLSFAATRRLAYMANFTDLCPEMAPPGWNLYVAAGVPQPSVGDFDAAAETDLMFADIEDVIPGFAARARVLSTMVTRDEWPPQRAVAGFDLPPATPLANLWNVGDGVKEYANGGTTACAETAKLVVDQIMARFPPRSGPVVGV